MDAVAHHSMACLRPVKGGGRPGDGLLPSESWYETSSSAASRHAAHRCPIIAAHQTIGGHAAAYPRGGHGIAFGNRRAVKSGAGAVALLKLRSAATVDGRQMGGSCNGGMVVDCLKRISGCRDMTDGGVVPSSGSVSIEDHADERDQASASWVTATAVFCACFSMLMSGTCERVGGGFNALLHLEVVSQLDPAGVRNDASKVDPGNVGVCLHKVLDPFGITSSACGSLSVSAWGFILSFETKSSHEPL
jgi:hypothetical protein